MPDFHRRALAGLLLGSLVAAAPTGPAPLRFGDPVSPARAAGTIRVGTFNVLNLFDDVDDPALAGDVDDAPMATSAARCRALAAMIRRLDADVLALQEVESLAALAAFRDAHLAGLGYRWIASEDVGYRRGVECAVLSRFPITATETWVGTDLDAVERRGPDWTPVPEEGRRGLRYQRSPLLADVRVSENYALTLVVLHHKSGADFSWHREAEALATVARLRALAEERPSRNLVVLGDFNAAPWDRSVRLYLEAGFSDVLAHRCTSRREEAREEVERYATHESGRVIDYVLLGPATQPELVVGSAHVLAGPWFDGYDWRRDPTPEGYASDHRPVAVDLVPIDGR